ncbi:MAG: thiamine diphosphokinase [Pseudomonadota bacterium]|nr:thiamine diphosphokinase [Pseudomonadota bacterium]MEC8667506.1 thiamine diphosphokinase [Pseudomonadota bacterium]
MSEEIVCAEGPVLLFGGALTKAAQAARDALIPWAELKDAPLVAADGGARLVLGGGLVPDAVIGDFDSLSDADRAQLDPARLHHISEQETTDFDKALRSIRAPVVVGIGFHGARIDHHLAAMSVLARHPDRPCILVGEEDVTCLCPPRITLDMTPGDWLSLYPLAPVTGRSSGLDWPIDGLDFAPDARIGTSNRVGADQVRLTMDAPAMLLILPRPALRPLLAALSRSDARWPSRAG